ncbi:MAG: hypothetical protein MJ105_07385 [Lachnospiraceae bacterium]|nr:hypothetical protein [Lachnospiraceae bacterium]
MKRKALLCTMALVLLTACGNKNNGEEPTPEEVLVEEDKEDITEQENVAVLEEEANQDEIETTTPEGNDSGEDDSSVENQGFTAVDTLSSGDVDAYVAALTYQGVYDFATNAEGTWNRTNTHSGYYGVITISDVTADSFEVVAEMTYFSHSGLYEGTAKFVNDYVAIAEYDYGDEPEYIAFIFEDDMMEVCATGSSSDLGFGMNVSIDGEFTKDAPAYTNDGILQATYSEQQLADLQRVLSPEKYEDFIFATENGVLTVTEDEQGTKVELFMPTMAYYSYEYEYSPAGGYARICFGEEECYQIILE